MGLPVLTPKTPPPGPNHLPGPTTHSSRRPCAAARTTPGPLLPSAPLCYWRLHAPCHLQGAQPFEADGDSPTLLGHSAHWPIQGTPGLPPRRGCSPGHTTAPRRQSRCPTGSLSLSQAKWPHAMGPSWPCGPPSQPQQLPLVTSPAGRYTSTQPCGWNTAPQQLAVLTLSVLARRGPGKARPEPTVTGTSQKSCWEPLTMPPRPQKRKQADDSTDTYGRRVVPRICPSTLVEPMEVDPPQNGDEPMEVDPPQVEEEPMEVDPPRAGLMGHYTTTAGVPPTAWCPKRRRTHGGSQGPSKQPAPKKRRHPSSRR